MIGAILPYFGGKRTLATEIVAELGRPRAYFEPFGGSLAVLMAKCQGKLTAYVSFYRPAGAGDDWDRTDLWNSAAEIPGVSVLRDEDGSVAASFNAATSGQVLLYDSRGDLQFAGGITSARGHSGDNSGREAIISIVNNQTEEHQGTPVFGCPIFDPHSQCNEGTHQ